jgi:GNAT superfamily N-acetyltransferase
MTLTAVPIATTIGTVEICLANPADLDDVLDILNESARWLASRGINQWRIDGFPRELIARNILQREVYVARINRRAVGTFTLMWSDVLFWPGVREEAGYIHRLAVRREARGLGVELLKFAERVTTSSGRKLLRLDCFSGNRALCSYYERVGFVHVADIEVDGRDDATVPESNARFFARQYQKSLPEMPA